MSGVISQVASWIAKSAGGFAPDPANNPREPETDTPIELQVDLEGQAMVRGPVMTDECSFRDHFASNSLVQQLTGTLTFTNGSRDVTGVGSLFTEELNRDWYVRLVGHDTSCWTRIRRIPNDETMQLDEPYAGVSGEGDAEASMWIDHAIGTTPGAIAVQPGQCALSSGADAAGGVMLQRVGDYMPMRCHWKASVSQRIADQVAFLGFRDDPLAPMTYAEVRFTGTDNTKVSFAVAWHGVAHAEDVTIPNAGTTDTSHRYRIVLTEDACILYIDDVKVWTHNDLDPLPGPYNCMELVAGVMNEGATSNTDLVLTGVFYSNHNVLEVATNYGFVKAE